MAKYLNFTSKKLKFKTMNAEEMYELEVLVNKLKYKAGKTPEPEKSKQTR